MKEQPPTQPYQLTREEAELIRAFRAVDRQLQLDILRVARALAAIDR